MGSLPADFFVTSTAFTKTPHINKYSTIDPASANLSQRGKVVIITGANRGLGRKVSPNTLSEKNNFVVTGRFVGLASAFAKSGAKAIVLVARSIPLLDEVEKDITAIHAETQVLKVEADIANPTAVASLYQQVERVFSTADVLINNAGVFTSNAPLAEAVAKEWWQDWEVNVKGTFLMTQGFLKLVGSEKSGTIINLATSGSLGVYPNLSSYTMSKLSTVHMQRFVAAENPNIAAMSLDPCLADTDMLLDDLKTLHLMDFELIGGSALWLTTKEAEFLNGRVFNVTWDVGELIARRSEIQADDQLAFSFKGLLGAAQFD